MAPPMLPVSAAETLISMSNDHNHTITIKIKRVRVKREAAWRHPCYRCLQWKNSWFWHQVRESEAGSLLCMTSQGGQKIQNYFTRTLQGPLKWFEIGPGNDSDIRWEIPRPAQSGPVGNAWLPREAKKTNLLDCKFASLHYQCTRNDLK